MHYLMLSLSKPYKVIVHEREADVGTIKCKWTGLRFNSIVKLSKFEAGKADWKLEMILNSSGRYVAQIFHLHLFF